MLVFLSQTCAPVEEVDAPVNIVAEASPVDSEVKPNKHHHEEKQNGDRKKGHEHHHHEGGHLRDIATPDEKKRLLEVFGNLTKEQQDACDKKSWRDELKNHTEEEKAAWKKLSETENKGKKMSQWNAKSDIEKACTVHKIEEMKKKMMGGKRGEENLKWGGNGRKQRGEQEMNKSGEENSKSRGNDKNGSIGQNSRRAGADKNINGGRRGQQKPQVQA